MRIDDRFYNVTLFLIPLFAMNWTCLMDQYVGGSILQWINTLVFDWKKERVHDGELLTRRGIILENGTRPLILTECYTFLKMARNG